ncbi:ImpB/MucB/SamB family protein [Streptomyces polygonati]|uniref:ImpB/MucB/SamB family protein n=1 Tax=Streptomyces polygonati TaxID=1617087 RepID=A0ABV8HPD0_9ACTN
MTPGGRTGAGAGSPTGASTGSGSGSGSLTGTGTGTGARNAGTRPRHIAHLHLHLRGGPPGSPGVRGALGGERYADALELLGGITPHVQAFPPDAVQLDLTSALRYFDLGPYDLVQTAKMRLMALYGIDSSAGLAGNRMLAAMAAASSAPGETTRIPTEPADMAAWLRPRPVTALPGIGRATATILSTYGLHTIGQVADLPAATLQRLLGVGPARLLAERARGHDPRPVTPRAPAAHTTADLVLDRDCLDPEQHHRAVLGLAERIGQRLRTEGQVTGRLTLTVRYADRSSSTRTRALAEATGHSPVLAATALGLLTALGLQRARVRAYTLRADELRPVADAHHQLRLDPDDARARAAEAAADRARRRFGPDAVHPATLAAARPAEEGTQR